MDLEEPFPHNGSDEDRVRWIVRRYAREWIETRRIFGRSPALPQLLGPLENDARSAITSGGYSVEHDFDRIWEDVVRELEASSGANAASTVSLARNGEVNHAANRAATPDEDEHMGRIIQPFVEIWIELCRTYHANERLSVQLSAPSRQVAEGSVRAQYPNVRINFNSLWDRVVQQVQRSAARNRHSTARTITGGGGRREEPSVLQTPQTHVSSGTTSTRAHHPVARRQESPVPREQSPAATPLSEEEISESQRTREAAAARAYEQARAAARRERWRRGL